MSASRLLASMAGESAVWSGMRSAPLFGSDDRACRCGGDSAVRRTRPQDEPETQQHAVGRLVRHVGHPGDPRQIERAERVVDERPQRFGRIAASPPGGMERGHRLDETRERRLVFDRVPDRHQRAAPDRRRRGALAREPEPEPSRCRREQAAQHLGRELARHLLIVEQEAANLAVAPERPEGFEVARRRGHERETCRLEESGCAVTRRRPHPDDGAESITRPPCLRVSPCHKPSSPSRSAPVRHEGDPHGIRPAAREHRLPASSVTARRRPRTRLHRHHGPRSHRDGGPGEELRSAQPLVRPDDHGRGDRRGDQESAGRAPRALQPLPSPHHHRAEPRVPRPVERRRLVAGLGTGWTEREFQMTGLPYPDITTRIRMLDEALTCIRSLVVEGRDDLRGRVLPFRRAASCGRRRCSSRRRRSSSAAAARDCCGSRPSTPTS